MTDQQDLSLLTEQDRDDIAGIKEHIDASYSQECADRLASALIAARAENKRKDEMLRSLEWAGTLYDGSEYEGNAICPECDAPMSDGEHLVDCKLAALLQSEKERCPVHDFELPCLGCAELALHVGVDEQEQTEKGGAE
ncbi:MAG: hypothetical protein KIT08_01415 [Anaerolineales bacterium]|nr:MAG: hypothetical protein KIT08_01415 [Anaerolineales bacterium]